MASPFHFDLVFAKAVTPDDSNDLPDKGCVGLHVRGTAGDVKVRFTNPDSSGSDVDAILYIAQGDYIKMPIKRVFSTGTAATNIVALYQRL